MNGITNFVKTLGVARIVVLAGVLAGLVGFFAFIILRLSEASMAPLYGPLEVADAGAVVARLEAMKVPYELKGDGTLILAPEDRVPRLRMALAEEGLPSNSSSIGYEIFDKQDAFGATSFMQNINKLRALEGELARTIGALDTIASTRVHLALPKRELFATEASEPSASIVVKTKAAGLSRAQVKAIQHLVASAVEGMKPQRVSIIDEAGELLSNDDSGQGGADSGGSYDERRDSFERNLRTEVEEIVSSIVGPGKARVRVTADIDFNRITENSERYDPDGQVVRSTQTVEENSNNKEGAAPEAVSVGQNLPEAGQTKTETAPGSTSSEASNRTEETVNYEISKTVKTEVVEAGRVKKLSVAVLVDGSYAKDKAGEVHYTPRPQADLDKIAALTRSAIGFDEKRGDQMTVVNLPFFAHEVEAAAEQKEPFLGLGKSDYMRIAELGGLLLVALLTIFLVVRPMLSRIFAVAAASAGAPALAAPHGQPAQLQAQGAAPASALPAGGMQALPRPAVTNAMIDIAQIEGQVKESSVRKVGEVIGKHPEEAMSIVRNWLYQGN